MTLSPEDQKLAAEAKKLDAEAAAAQALAAKNAAEARRAEAEARRFELDVEAGELQVAEIRARHEEFEETNRARQVSDDKLRIYRFSEAVSSTAVAKCMSALNRWDRLDPECDIEVIFNSPGGSVIDGMALFDTLSSLSKRGGGTHQVTLGSLGYAASMAGILLQAGDVRWIGKRSYLMIHEVASGAIGKIGEIKDEVEFLDKICDQITEIFVERSGKISKRQFEKLWGRRDVWLLADEALKHGFVDEVR